MVVILVDREYKNHDRTTRGANRTARNEKLEKGVQSDHCRISYYMGLTTGTVSLITFCFYIFSRGETNEVCIIWFIYCRSINEFTKSEHRSVSPPDFEWIGPVAHQVTEIFKVLFPAAILVVMYIAWKRYRQHVKELVNPFTQYTYLIAVSLAYVFAIFLTGKTFSSPFHIWYIPLLTLFPYKNLKQQWFAYVSALLMLGMDTSSYLIAPKLHIWGSPITLTNVRDAFRFIPMFLLLSFFLKEGTMGLKKS